MPLNRDAALTLCRDTLDRVRHDVMGLEAGPRGYDLRDSVLDLVEVLRTIATLVECETEPNSTRAP